MNGHKNRWIAQFFTPGPSDGGAGKTCAHWKQMTAVWQYVPHNTFGLEFNHDHCEISRYLAKNPIDHNNH